MINIGFHNFLCEAWHFQKGGYAFVQLSLETFLSWWWLEWKCIFSHAIKSTFAWSLEVSWGVLSVCPHGQLNWKPLPLGNRRLIYELFTTMLYFLHEYYIFFFVWIQDLHINVDFWFRWGLCVQKTIMKWENIIWIWLKMIKIHLFVPKGGHTLYTLQKAVWIQIFLGTLFQGLCFLFLSLWCPIVITHLSCFCRLKVH